MVSTQQRPIDTFLRCHYQTACQASLGNTIIPGLSLWVNNLYLSAPSSWQQGLDTVVWWRRAILDSLLRALSWVWKFKGSNRGSETQARLTVKVLGQPEGARESVNARTEGCVTASSESSCGCWNRHIPRGNLTQKANGSSESQCMGGIRDIMRNALTVGCSWQDFLSEKFSVTMSFLALKINK